VQPGLGREILLSLAIIAAAVLVRFLIAALVRAAAGEGPLRREGARGRFWITQGTSLVVLVGAAVALATLWIADAGRFAAIAGIVTAGIAVSLQRVITSFAAYLIILRGRVFTVGDRITMGGVRGDVVRVGFMQTAVMEMGAPPRSQNGDPQTWVAARQYTGRIVSVTNDKIFDNPVYNYTREFPYLWDEIIIPIKYGADRARAESILLAAARHHTEECVRAAGPSLVALRERFVLAETMTLEPKVYLRLTDNWVELSLRFLAPVHGVRGIKDAMTREVLSAFGQAGLSTASTTFAVTGLPTVRVEEMRG
jgi:small-conductance mechanosensitive channel